MVSAAVWARSAGNSDSSDSTPNGLETSPCTPAVSPVYEVRTHSRSMWSRKVRAAKTCCGASEPVVPCLTVLASRSGLTKVRWQKGRDGSPAAGSGENEDSGAVPSHFVLRNSRCSGDSTVL